jgi:hypothetical protein
MTNLTELNHRQNNGIAVTLLWSRGTDELVVRVYDARTDEQFDLACRAADALDVFYHPFAYGAPKLVADPTLAELFAL